MKIALEYRGYMIENPVAAGHEINALDMSDPKYRIIDVEVPNWLIAGFQRGQRDGRWEGQSAELYAARYILDDIYPLGWDRVLRPLTRANGKFAESLKTYFVTHGCLTDKQANAFTRYN